MKREETPGFVNVHFVEQRGERNLYQGILLLREAVTRVNLKMKRKNGEEGNEENSFYRAWNCFYCLCCFYRLVNLKVVI